MRKVFFDMSVFGTLGTRNVLILFFSALSISLLLLLVLFSVFFKNLDFSVKTKDLATAPTLGADSTSPGDVVTTPTIENPWSSEAIRQKLNLILPGEAEKLKKSVEDQTTAMEGEVGKKSSKGSSNVKPDEYYMGVEADPSSITQDENDSSSSDTAAPTPGTGDESETPASTRKPVEDAPKVNVVQSAPASRSYRVYMGGFGSRADAENARANLQAQGYSAVLKQGSGGYQLQLGVFGDEGRARQLAGQTGASVEAQ
jgi:cell division protein FtsN